MPWYSSRPAMANICLSLDQDFFSVNKRNQLRMHGFISVTGTEQFIHFVNGPNSTQFTKVVCHRLVDSKVQIWSRLSWKTGGFQQSNHKVDRHQDLCHGLCLPVFMAQRPLVWCLSVSHWCAKGITYISTYDHLSVVCSFSQVVPC